MTLRSRSSILPNGQSAFDTALRVPASKIERYARAVRHLDTGYRSWINGVCVTDRHCPIQNRAFGQEELRMRSCGVVGGSVSVEMLYMGPKRPHSAVSPAHEGHLHPGAAAVPREEEGVGGRPLIFTINDTQRPGRRSGPFRLTGSGASSSGLEDVS